MLTGKVSALVQSKVDRQLTMAIGVLVVKTIVILSVVKLCNRNGLGITDFWDGAVTFS
jgi:hypothetical protein